MKNLFMVLLLSFSSKAGTNYSAFQSELGVAALLSKKSWNSAFEYSDNTSLALFRSIALFENLPRGKQAIQRPRGILHR
jgi:hypothetical protein